jgi:excisionase family DNA binding protein
MNIINTGNSTSVVKLALSRHEVAQSLGISVITVDRLVKRGQLRASRATRRPLFTVSEIERFLAETTFASVA